MLQAAVTNDGSSRVFHRLWKSWSAFTVRVIEAADTTAARSEETSQRVYVVYEGNETKSN